RPLAVELRQSPSPGPRISSDLGEKPSRTEARSSRVGQNGRIDYGAVKTSLGIWALGSMITRFVPGGRRAWRPHRRLRVPLSAGAVRGERRRGAGGAGWARHLLPRRRAAPRPALRAWRAR